MLFMYRICKCQHQLGIFQQIISSVKKVISSTPKHTAGTCRYCRNSNGKLLYFLLQQAGATGQKIPLQKKTAPQPYFQGVTVFCLLGRPCCSLEAYWSWENWLQTPVCGSRLPAFPSVGNPQCVQETVAELVLPECEVMAKQEARSPGATAQITSSAPLARSWAPGKLGSLKKMVSKVRNEETI